MNRRQRGIATLFAGLAWIALAFFLWKAVEKLPTWEDWQRYQSGNTYKALSAFAAFFILALVLRTVRFGVLARQAAPIPWHRIAFGFPWIFMIGAVTPFRLGEGYRAVWIRKHGGTSSRIIGYLFGERFSDLVILSTLLVIGLVSAPTVGGGIGKNLVFALLLLTLLGYFSLWMASLYAHRLEQMLRGRANFAVELLDAFSYMRHPGLHLGTIALSISIWMAMAAGFYSALLLLNISPSVGFAGAVCALGAVNLAGLLSATPGNVGSFQAAMVASLIMFNVQATDALIASVIIQAAGLGSTLSLGFLARGLDIVWPDEGASD